MKERPNRGAAVRWEEVGRNLKTRFVAAEAANEKKQQRNGRSSTMDQKATPSIAVFIGRSQ